jgi:hypothetical protein
MYIVSYLLANGKHNIEPKIAGNEYPNDLLLIPVTTGEQTACFGTVSPVFHVKIMRIAVLAAPQQNQLSILTACCWCIWLNTYLGPYSVHAGSYSAIPKGSKGNFM